MPKPCVSVVIPAYDEAARILPTLAAISAWSTSLRDWDVEVVIVDDGSTDGTCEVSSAAPPGDLSGIKCVRYTPNKGKGAAFKRGVEECGGEVVMLMDADGSTPPSEGDKLLAALKAGADVAIGSRYKDRRLLEGRQPWFRELPGRGFNLLTRLMIIRGVADTQCGFKAFTRAAALNLVGPLFTEGFAFDVELLCRARRRGMSVVEIPVRWKDSAGSRVKPLRDAPRSFVAVFKVWLKAR